MQIHKTGVLLNFDVMKSKPCMFRSRENRRLSQRHSYSLRLTIDSTGFPCGLETQS